MRNSYAIDLRTTCWAGLRAQRHQYKLVRLAAHYDTSLEWFHRGHSNPAVAISRMLDIHASTAREWIRVGHALDELPRIDQAFRTNALSYAKTRILTRWADPGNEEDLLALAADRTANRLTAAVAKYLAADETDLERDERLHELRSVTTYTDADGMIVIRAVLPPNIGKQLTTAIDTIVAKVAATPVDTSDAPADGSPPQTVSEPATVGGQDLSADAPGPTMGEQLQELKQRWQPAGADHTWIPSLAQQRADALVLLFLGTNIELTTEVVIHVRGDGTTFDDGTPITNNTVCQRLDKSFLRLMIHDCAPRLSPDRPHDHHRTRTTLRALPPSPPSTPTRRIRVGRVGIR